MAADNYGLWTTMGVGRRVSHVAALLQLGSGAALDGKLRVLFPILQDRDATAARLVETLCERHHDLIEPTIIPIAEKQVACCLGCDVCPSEVDVDSRYRCVIHNQRADDLESMHHLLLHQDAIVPVVYSTDRRTGLISNYQRFIERTRYLRRGDYIFSDCLLAPLVIEEAGSSEHMALRAVTSWVRHHTVVSQPLVAIRYQGSYLNESQIRSRFARFVARARQLTAGRLRMFVNGQAPCITQYNPVGYVLSSEKDKDDAKLGARERVVRERHRHLAEDAGRRLAVEEAVSV
jgi:multimeric flavodoxin WrbA